MYISPSRPSWEDRFASWAKPPTKTEATRCKNAVAVVRNAISQSVKLSNKNIKVFAQGSYRNRVNVRKDSDVDVGVLCWDWYFSDSSQGVGNPFFGAIPRHHLYMEFKEDLQYALAVYLGPHGVRRGNKAFHLQGNTYRVEADVTPFFEYRHYQWDRSYHCGIALAPDRGGRIVNYPERLLDWWPQNSFHYENGVLKNAATRRRFKGVVRILKKVRNQMVDAGIPAAIHVPGFLIECLVWNAPVHGFAPDLRTEQVRSVLLLLWQGTRTDAACGAWTEVNGIKLLFHPSQPWTRQQASEFINATWMFLGMQSA